MVKVNQASLPKIVYDIEVVPGAFTCRTKRLGVDKEAVYYVDENEQRRQEVVAKLKEVEPKLNVMTYNQFMEFIGGTSKIGFNTEAYDSFILPQMVAKSTPEEVFKVSQALIQSGTPFKKRIPAWAVKDPSTGRKLKREYTTLDVRKQFLKDPEAKKKSESGADEEDDQNTGSLKDQEVKLNLDVREFNVDFTEKNLTVNDLVNLIVYNGYDVRATEQLYLRPEIQGNISAKQSLIDLTKKRIGVSPDEMYKYNNLVNKTSRQITEKFITKDGQAAPIKIKPAFTLQNEGYLDIYDQMGMPFVKQGYLQYFKKYEARKALSDAVKLAEKQLKDLKREFGYGKLTSEQETRMATAKTKVSQANSALFNSPYFKLPLRFYDHQSYVAKAKVDKKTGEILSPEKVYETINDVPKVLTNGKEIRIRTHPMYRNFDGTLTDNPPVPHIGKMKVGPSTGGIHAALPYSGPAVHLDLSSYYKLIIDNRGTLGDLSEAQDALFAVKQQAGAEGDMQKRAGAKVGLNAVSGALDSTYGVLPNNLAMTETRIYGQAIILTLAKRLLDAGYHPIHLNTDGIYLDSNGLTPDTPEWDDYIKKVSVISETWAHEFHMELEPETVDWFAQKDTNNRRENYGGKLKVAGATLNGADGELNVNNNYKVPFVYFDASLAVLSNDDKSDDQHTKIASLHGLLAFLKDQAEEHPNKFRYPVKQEKGTVNAVGHVEGQKNETGILSLAGTVIEEYSLAKNVTKKITGFPTELPNGDLVHWTRHLEPIDARHPIDIHQLNYEAYVEGIVKLMVEPWVIASPTAKKIADEWHEWEKANHQGDKKDTDQKQTSSDPIEEQNRFAHFLDKQVNLSENLDQDPAVAR